MTSTRNKTIHKQTILVHVRVNSEKKKNGKTHKEIVHGRLHKDTHTCVIFLKLKNDNLKKL